MLTAILSCLLVERALQLPFGRTVLGLGARLWRAGRVLASRRISDHWKEKGVGAYARGTLRATLGLAPLLAVLPALATLLTLVDGVLVAGVQDFLNSRSGLLFGLLTASAAAQAVPAAKSSPRPPKSSVSPLSPNSEPSESLPAKVAAHLGH